jgi:periplasmic protein TonB
MDSPRQGFRRAAATSWTLVGIGLAGVTGASALAYADTFKPAPDSPPDVAVPEPQLVPDAGPSLAPPPADLTTPETTPETTSEAPPPAPVPDPPVTTAPPTPEYTPTYTPKYTPEPTYQTPAAPSSTPPTTKRRYAPTTVMAPNYSPHISISRGS